MSDGDQLRTALARLRQVTSEATPGKWTLDVEDYDDGTYGDGMIAIPEIARSLHDGDWAERGDWKRDLANATHIATFSPALTAALIAVVEAAVAEHDGHYIQDDLNSPRRNPTPEECGECAALKALAEVLDGEG